MLFSLFNVVVNLFHACVTLAKQVSVLIHAALSKVSSCFWKETLQAKMSWSFHRIISTHASHCVLTVAWHIFIRVDAANEAVHELVAEPVQEPRAEEQQEDAVEHAPEDLVNPADLQGKPRSITII